MMWLRFFLLMGVLTCTQAFQCKSSDYEEKDYLKIHLIVAVKENNVDRVQACLNQGDDPDVVDEDGHTPLHWVSEKFDEDAKEIIKQLIHHKADINKQDREGWTPLHFAIFQSNFVVAKILLEYGAHPNLVNKEGITPLWQLLKGEKMDKKAEDTAIAMLEAKEGVNVHATDKKGNTLLHYAVLNRYNKVIKKLLELKADLHAENRNGVKPLDLILLI
jgi:ankyrin repeat protein